MSHITVVAQTPFQLFGSLLIARFAQIPCDLWLIDHTLANYLKPCRDSGIWRDVYYAEKSGGDLWGNTMSSRLKRARAFFQSRKKIKEYLRNNSPRTIFIFSDNHELTAYFAQYRKSHPETDVVLVEEGTTVYFAPDRIRTSRWKGICRYILGIPNPWGYNIGWSPQINKLLLSDPDKAHPKYLKDRLCVKWPEGPFPESAINDFISLMGGIKGIPAAEEVDIIYIGTPLSESGIVTLEEELNLVDSFVTRTDSETTWIKPHPFDTPGKYVFCDGARTFDKELNNVPAEILFHLLRPRLVMASYFSSAVLNYCMRYGKGAIFYLPPTAPPSLKAILDQHFSDLPIFRMINDLSEVPAALHDLLGADSQRQFTSEECTTEWQHTVARMLA